MTSKRNLVLSISIHKTFGKELKKAQFNPTNTAKLFMYISLLLNQEEFPNESRDHYLSENTEIQKSFISVAIYWLSIV